MTEAQIMRMATTTRLNAFVKSEACHSKIGFKSGLTRDVSDERASRARALFGTRYGREKRAPDSAIKP